MSANRWITMKIYGHLWKCLNIAEHSWKSHNITENVWKLLWTSMTISGHLWKCLNNTEHFWKLLFQIWNGQKTSIGTLHSWLVSDLCYVNFVWTTFKKNPKGKRKLIIRTKWTHFRQKKTRTERASYCFRRYSRNDLRCYPPPPPQKVE